MDFASQRREWRRPGQRVAFELPVPGRNGQPTRFMPVGGMATAPQNDAAILADAQVQDCGPFGAVRALRRRARRRDGTLAPLPLANGQADGPDVMREAAAREDVLRALADGGELLLAPGWRLALSGTGAVRAIPYKGAIQKYASAEDVAQALASGVFTQGVSLAPVHRPWGAHVDDAAPCRGGYL